ncbi:LysR family transcriptional regulator [Deinococcus psychrotolerans]|uniref:LysR family transcriptional regulator n=1 Tax=Deinococcus psychrotolerans TaxID=2489213 RepID=A0A3G8YAM7_9DEIO|nr:LysR family transcriptional regulator [Deinococcus psychrotolerans]AZI42429.1 LysR family transcriptional regulator [Deinococcus psychrotolerans]
MAIQADGLICFAAVARLGNVSRAAEQLNRSQPALSAQLRGLREAVGEPLYIRRRSGIELTEAGRALLPHALSAERGLRQAREWAEKVHSGQWGQLSLLASVTAAEYFLPQHLAQFCRAFPEVQVKIEACNSQHVEDLMLSGRGELGIVEGELSRLDSALSARPLLEDRLVLVISPQHPWAAGTPQLADLSRCLLIQREPGSGTRAVTERAFQLLGLERRTLLEASGTQTIKELVMQGVGAAFLSSLAVQREVGAGQLLMLEFPELSLARPLTLVTLEGQPLSLPAQQFIKLLTATQTTAGQNSEV